MASLGTRATGSALTGWLERVTEDDGPFALTALSGGNSNETTLVESRRGRWLLRRPPAARIDASAHSLEREYRVLIALADTHVPVPRPLALERGEERPALLMEFVDGVSLTDALPGGAAAGNGAGVTGPAGAVGAQAIDALADLHMLPWRELGLEDFGRPHDVLARQVRRWRRQYEGYRHRELPDFDRVAAWLEKHRPEEPEPGILHGDFHVDNCLFSATDSPRLLAVIDWEMATIGNPLLDAGLLLAFWGDERLPPLAMPRIQGFSRAAGAPSRAELAARYEQRSGRSLEHLGYYMTLAFWKLAAIVEGAHLHHTTGALRSPYAAALEDDVPRLLAEAAHFAGID